MESKQEYDGNLTHSLAQARSWLASVVGGGSPAVCPCCERPAGYEVRITRSHAREFLRFVVAASEQASRYNGRLVDQAIHVPDTLGETAKSYSQNCLSQCKHFGLVEPSGPPGFWKLTSGGVRFAIGMLHVPKAAWVFKGDLVHYVEEAGLVSIHDLVGRIEYDTVMDGQEEAGSA